jgi:hypothetical protein
MMQFFTDEKCGKGVAHAEYEKFWEVNRGLLPDDLLRINGGMLPESCFPDCEAAIELHDARVQEFLRDSSDVRILLYGDHLGDLRIIRLHYSGVVECEGITAAILSNNMHSDLMCHETTIDKDGIFKHQMLFASGDILSIRFRRFSVTVSDDEEPQLETRW